MALMTCPECSKEVSDKSKVCIHCGFPIDEYIQEQKQKRHEEMMKKSYSIIIREPRPYTKEDDDGDLGEIFCYCFYIIDNFISPLLSIKNIDTIEAYNKMVNSVGNVYIEEIPYVYLPVFDYIASIISTKHDILEVDCPPKEIPYDALRDFKWLQELIEREHLEDLAKPFDIEPYLYYFKHGTFDKPKEKSSSNTNTQQQVGIKCPTCGSTNVEIISTGSKVGGALMFGLLSRTAKSQFKCKTCGYKW